MYGSFVTIRNIGGKESHLVCLGVCASLRVYPLEARKSLTWDRGSEMSKHEIVIKLLNMPIYFADPYNAYQKGSNKNNFISALIQYYVLPYFHLGSDDTTTNECNDYSQLANIDALLVPERIRTVGDPTGCLQKAKDIMGLSDICDKTFRRIYGTASKQVHPDQSKESDAETLFTHLAKAKDMLEKQRKIAC